MKISPTQFILAFIGTANLILASEKSWEPPRIDYRDVLQSIRQTNPDTPIDVENSIRDAIFTGPGILSITNVISPSEKKKLFDAMFECYASSTNSAKEVVYLDGTKRSTWAAPSSGSIQTCDVLNEASRLMRNQIGEVTYNLALKIDDMLSKLGQSVVFPKSSPDGVGYNLSELVSQGEQLDHFHIYSSNPSSGTSTEKVFRTIDWHTDYGFALAFVPGQVMIDDTSSPHKYTPSKDFFIRLPDGSRREVSFTADDDVVILLGDGVSHINNVIDDDEVNLRAVPHSFVMPDDKDVLRMWYGRMLLFPVDMLHSNLNRSFGDLKEAMNSDPSYHLSSNSNHLGYALGCSSPEALIPRLLADETMSCDDDQFMCWHACFNHTEEVSPDACESRDLELACVSSIDGSIWDGETHGKEFEPTCILADDATESSPTTSPNVQATESPTSSTNATPHSSPAFLVASVAAFLMAHVF